MRKRSARPRFQEAALDTSALYAVLDDEECAGRLLDAFDRFHHLCVSAGTLAELSILLLARRGTSAVEELDRFLAAYAIEVVEVDDRTIARVREGFVKFGKGMRSPAHLNFGDLFAYALAKEREVPLFFLGSDFDKTDVADAMKLSDPA